MIIKFSSTQLYTWVERSTVIVKYIAQEHDKMSLARAPTQTAQSRGKHTNHEATKPPQDWVVEYLICPFLIMF